MEKKVIVPQDKISKAEEIKVINDFIAALPKDSYLIDLLAGFDTYCETQISNDWGMNPLQTIDELRLKIDELTKAYDKLNADHEFLLKKHKDATLTYTKQIAELGSQLDITIASKRSENADAWAEYQKLVEENDKLKEKAEQDTNMILELKAYAWDQYQAITKLERQLDRA